MSYYEVSNYRETLEPMDYTQTLASVYFRFDNQYEEINRQIYSISDLLGEIGGF